MDGLYNDDCEKKVVFLDIDGTLVKSGSWLREKKGIGWIDPAALESIKRAKAEGHRFGIMTGGMCPRALKISELIGSDFGLMELGLVIYHEGRMSLTVCREDLETLHALREKLAPFKDSVGFSFDPNERHLLALYPERPGMSPETLSEELAKAEGAAEIMQGFDAYYSSEALDIVPKGVSKASALSILVEKMGIPRHSLVGIGDSEGDVPALVWIADGGGTAVLLSNSDAKTRKRLVGVPRVITTENAEGAGVSEFIERHLLRADR